MFDVVSLVSELVPEPTSLLAMPALFVIFTLKGAFVGKIFPTSVFLPGYVLATGAEVVQAALIVLVVTLGYMVGQLVIYAGSRRYGPTFVLSLPYVTVDPDAPELARLEVWFEEYGGPAIFVTNFLPWIRGLVTIPAGVGSYPAGRFTVHMGTSTLLYHVLYVGVALAGLQLIA
ncbi:VTT domain-containing protein [Halobacteria archaeon AArc-dxtr1]|nr:VTT domain-containing protein [Halobacteria archaeon AArc-dxtr1]